MFGKYFEKCLLFAVVSYIGFNAWSFYEIFSPNQCLEVQECLFPDWSLDDIYTASVSIESNKTQKTTDSFKVENISLSSDLERVFDVKVPKEVFKNGTASATVIITNNKNAQQIYSKTFPIASYREGKPKAFNLMSSEENKTENSTEIFTHWLSVVHLFVLNHPISFYRTAVPPELMPLLQAYFSGSKAFYKPIFHISPDLQSTSDWVELQPNEFPLSSNTLNLTFNIDSLSIGKLRLRCMLEQTSQGLKNFGFKDKDIEDVRGLFTDTNVYLLLTTVIVSILHLFFDFLAFKNDIHFWRQAENTSGISIRTIIWRCCSTTIIFFYLSDERSSLLILVPSGIGMVIEYWKLLRMSKVSISWSGGISVGNRNDKEKETDELDAYFMRRLAILIVPLCIAGAIYSLLYTAHRSWYSWILKTAVNGVYAFGFLLMTPQLFINYRLKSVANLPWRALTYKAFNTFIDDFFAFIIKMPTAHRIACFRDDIVFVIFMYQCWLYPVDHSRVNEYGQCGQDTVKEEGEIKDNKKEERKKKKKAEKLTKTDGKEKTN